MGLLEESKRVIGVVVTYFISRVFVLGEGHPPPISPVIAFLFEYRQVVRNLSGGIAGDVD